MSRVVPIRPDLAADEPAPRAASPPPGPTATAPTSNSGTPLPDFGLDEFGRPAIDRYRWMDLAERSTLTGPEIRVAMAIAGWAHYATGRDAHPGAIRIARRAGYSDRDKVRPILRRLHEKGWLNLTAPRAGARAAVWELALPPAESQQIKYPS